ncbi:signal peptide protein [Skermanella stibiiresistens SB22]|uniref:Signal peptide protein n=1 Tax=Skermanella stibiiresistens SB22 TaxID=1385369 RepID=W9GSW3_9PROT|nr:EAL domain-containing protein [Skermanella stibiiresistens]EWY36849.1 signal peptide protein [Skermanella stibiiresistens SB22]
MLASLQDAVDRRNAIFQAIADGAAAMVGHSDWRTGIDHLLGRLGTAAGVSRVYLFEVHEAAGQGPAQTCRHDWAAPGLAPLAGDPRNTDEKLVGADPTLTDWTERRRRGELIQGLTRDLSGYLREDFEYQRILSFVSVPILLDGVWWGHLGFDDCESERVWSELELDVLKTAAALIAGAVERGRAAGVLRTSEALKSAMLDTALDCVITIDDGGLVVEFNRAAERTFGWRRETVIGLPLSEVIVPPEMRGRHEAGLSRYLTSGESRVLGSRIEVEGMRSDGGRMPLELAITEVPTSEGRFFTAYLRDITERRQARDRLERMAYFDTVTGLPNRAQLLKQVAGRQTTSKSPWIVAVELMRFGSLRISLGTAFADTLLCALTARLRERLGPDALLARTGDRQLAVLGSGGGAEETARRLAQALYDAFHLDGRTIFMTASYGIAVGPAEPEALLRDAELACERAVESGGGTCLYDETMHAAQLDRLSLETDLRHAIDAGDQLWVAYQPIVALPEGRLAGFEALVRWDHPTRGRLSPTVFIPIAEVTGLIVPLGRLVLHRACHQMVRWTAMREQGAEPLFMSVNLSARQLGDRDLLETVTEALAESGIDPAQVKLELTESAAMSHAGETIGLLWRLKALGLRLSIDDFGTGYSSLSYLHRFPVDSLKVDQSFVAAMCRSTEGRDMVRIIVDLAHMLKLDVIAEGIETAEDAKLLSDMACGFGQGYLFSAPLPPREAASWITSSEIAGR